jgi:esterase/lipase
MNNKNIKQKNMANYQEVNETTQEMFTNAISESDLSRYLKITVLANNKLKELFKIMKANDILKYMTDDDVIIVLNEIIFEKFSDEQKSLIIEESLAYIGFDTEKDKVVITSPDFIAHSGVLRKYGFSKIDEIRQTTNMLFQAEKEAEDERKVLTQRVRN